MSEPRFFPAPKPVSLAEIATRTDSELRGDGAVLVSGVGPVESAGPGDFAYLDNASYIPALQTTAAAACAVAPKLADRAPAGLALLISKDPYRVFAQVTALLYPDAMSPTPVFEDRGVAPGAVVHPDARLEADVTVDPGAVIGPRAEIGAGTVIAANAVIGADVRIGRDSYVGPGASVLHALLGNRVILHGGVRVGQDGFGFAMSPRGHLKVPQIGRVIIQDDVEIGASTCVARGSTRDTIIGEGTKIDNLCMIAHNVVIGRHCVIVSQVGISGSCTVGDFVVMAGQVGLAGHLNIGSGAQIGAQAGVMKDVPAGAKVGGSPATSMRQWLREVAWLRRASGGAPDKGTPEKAE